MAIDNDFLASILADDDMGLLDKVEIGKQKKQEIFNLADAREKEVADWIEKYGRDPAEDAQDVIERRLARRLRAIRNAAEATSEPNEDPLDSPLVDQMLSELDDLGINDFSNSILKPREQRTKSAFVAKRTPVKDFSLYQSLFDTAQAEIDAGLRKVLPFSAAGMREGRFYIAGGILCFIDEIYENEKTSFGRVDKRLHIIFANMTESYMLMATFRKIMSEENGRSITETEKDAFGHVKDAFSKEDFESGYIYVLRSLSEEPVIKPYGEDFYKVGYTGDTVEKRISNAVNEPTYLCAPVRIIEKWRCTNINARALEAFLHRFLASANVRIMVNDKGRSQVASEWYNVPLDVLEAMVPLILNGTIRRYQYDSSLKKLIRRKHA